MNSPGQVFCSSSLSSTDLSAVSSEDDADVETLFYVFPRATANSAGAACHATLSEAVFAASAAASPAAYSRVTPPTAPATEWMCGVLLLLLPAAYGRAAVLSPLGLLSQLNHLRADAKRLAASAYAAATAAATAHAPQLHAALDVPVFQSLLEPAVPVDGPSDSSEHGNEEYSSFFFTCSTDVLFPVRPADGKQYGSLATDNVAASLAELHNALPDQCLAEVALAYDTPLLRYCLDRCGPKHALAVRCASQQSDDDGHHLPMGGLYLTRAAAFAASASSALRSSVAVQGVMGRHPESSVAVIGSCSAGNEAGGDGGGGITDDVLAAFVKRAEPVLGEGRATAALERAQVARDVLTALFGSDASHWCVCYTVSSTDAAVSAVLRASRLDSAGMSQGSSVLQWEAADAVAKAARLADTVDRRTALLLPETVRLCRDMIAAARSAKGLAFADVTSGLLAIATSNWILSSLLGSNEHQAERTDDDGEAERVVVGSHHSPSSPKNAVHHLISVRVPVAEDVGGSDDEDMGGDHPLRSDRRVKDDMSPRQTSQQLALLRQRAAADAAVECASGCSFVAAEAAAEGIEDALLVAAGSHGGMPPFGAAALLLSVVEDEVRADAITEETARSAPFLNHVLVQLRRKGVTHTGLRLRPESRTVEVRHCTSGWCRYSLRALCVEHLRLTQARRFLLEQLAGVSAASHGSVSPPSREAAAALYSHLETLRDGVAAATSLFDSLRARGLAAVVTLPRPERTPTADAVAPVLDYATSLLHHCWSCPSHLLTHRRFCRSFAIPALRAHAAASCSRGAAPYGARLREQTDLLAFECRYRELCDLAVAHAPDASSALVGSSQVVASGRTLAALRQLTQQQRATAAEALQCVCRGYGARRHLGSLFAAELLSPEGMSGAKAGAEEIASTEALWRAAQRELHECADNLRNAFSSVSAFQQEWRAATDALQGQLQMVAEELETHERGRRLAEAASRGAAYEEARLLLKCYRERCDAASRGRGRAAAAAPFTDTTNSTCNNSADEERGRRKAREAERRARATSAARRAAAATAVELYDARCRARSEHRAESAMLQAHLRRQQDRFRKYEGVSARPATPASARAAGSRQGVLAPPPLSATEDPRAWAAQLELLSLLEDGTKSPQSFC